MIRRASFFTAVALLVVACQSVPKAEQDEIDIRDQWAAKVPPADRDRIIAEAERHTAWAEKAKLRYEVDQFQKLVKTQERRARATTRHTTTHEGSPHFSTTRHGTTEPSD